MFGRKRSAPIDPWLTATMRVYLLQAGVTRARHAPARMIHNVIALDYPGGLTGFYTDYINDRL